jgi:hypothetical protein
VLLDTPLVARSRFSTTRSRNGFLRAITAHACVTLQALGWRELRTRQGDRVRFCIADAFLPSAEELAVFAAPDEKVEGTVIDFSDSGSEPDYFAVIDVIRRCTVVVPADKAEIVPGKHADLLD